MSWPKKRRLLPAVAVIGVVAGLLWLPRPSEQPAVYLTEHRSDAAVQLARQELLETIDDMQPTRRLAMPSWLGGTSPQVSVVVGTPANPEVQQLTHKYGVALPALAPEEYLIQPLQGGSTPRVLVAGGDVLGVAYGMLKLSEDLRLHRGYLETPLPVRRAPDMALRLVSDPLDPTYPGPAQALRWGYNAVMTEPWPSLVFYEQFSRDIYDPAVYGEARSWVEEQRRTTHAQIAKAKALHLRVLAPSDVISLPAQVLEMTALGVSDGLDPPRYCIERPQVQAILAAGLDEFFAEFPEIDGIMVRTGENYPLGPLTGNSPMDIRCNGQESQRRTWEFLYGQVVTRHKKSLILRAWDLGSEGSHAQPHLAQSLDGPLTNPTDLTFSYKITETDFWRYNRLNPNLLNSQQTRMVELQAAREYEGKGAFPNYVGEVYGVGPPEVPGPGGLRAAYRAGVREAWVWPKGGGWNGPELRTDLWREANIYATSRLLWNVDADPDTIALDWSRLHFGDAAGPAMASLLTISSEVVLKAFYPQCYAINSGPWTPNALWVRDDAVAGGDPATLLYQTCKEHGGLEQALADQETALALVVRMQATFEAARPFIDDGQLAQQVEVSLEYERSLLAVLHDYLSGLFYTYRFYDSGDPVLARQALESFDRLEESWRVHHQVVALLPWAASVYQDGGMLTTVQAALEVLAPYRSP